MIIRLIVTFVLVSIHLYAQNSKDNLQVLDTIISGENKKVLLASATEISAGVLFGKFTADDGPLRIMGSIIVPSGQILEFGPGTRVFIDGKYSTITVFGQIKLKGTATAPVIIESAKLKPNPWDWDRIYCRSRKRSEFKFAEIRNSNYGIVVENGNVRIEYCRFEKNSIHSLVVKNSDVYIKKSLFMKGHVVPIFLQAGANLVADSVIILNNITGIVCDEQSFLKMNKGYIKGNRHGIAVKAGASVSIVAAEITRNGVGIVSEEKIPKKMREMVYQNTIDAKVVNSKSMAKMLKPPQEIKSIILPSNNSGIRTNSNFKPGFFALKAPRQQTASVIGNVTLGAKFFSPTSLIHPVDIDTTNIDTIINGNDTTYNVAVASKKYQQTKYPGEHGDREIDGLQPELALFVQGKTGDIDVSLNLDTKLNTWYTEYNIDEIVEARDTTYDSTVTNIPFIFNTAVLQMNFMDQQFIIGDFFENISELSMYGRKVRGLRFSGNLFEMGRGTKRINFKLGAGQTERKKDIGDHELDIFGDTTDTGSAIRQQFTYLADISLKPNHYTTFFARGIISNDQVDNGFPAEVVKDTAVADPIAASSGALGANVILIDGKLNVNLEIDIGSHDTVSENEWDEIVWYKPSVLPSLGRIFGTFTKMDSFLNHMAIMFDIDAAVNEIDLRGSYMYIAPEFYSAGNPYLESDRHTVRLRTEKIFSKYLSAYGAYEYEQTSASNIFIGDSSSLSKDDLQQSDRHETEGPTNRHKLIVAGEYAFGKNRPTINLDLDFGLHHKNEQFSATVSSDSAYIKENVIYKEAYITPALSLKHQFENGINYSLGYMLKRRDDFTDFTKDKIAMQFQDAEDSWRHGIKVKFGFKIKRYISSKTRAKISFGTELEDTVQNIDWKLQQNLRINIVPRRLRLTVVGNYREKLETQGVDRVQRQWTQQKSLETILKVTITSKLSTELQCKFENYCDQTPSSAENYDVKIGGFHFTYLF